MEKFLKIRNQVKNQFEKMSKDADCLFTLNLEKNELWEIYLNSFPLGTNEIYREKREHDCSACRHFINNFGDVVFIINNKIVSIWDFETNDTTYNLVFKAMVKYIKTKEIKDIFRSNLNKIGVRENYEETEDGSITTTWSHFHVLLPSKFINNSSDSIATIKGKYRDIKNVFERSLKELSEESVLTILELINQKSLYKGEEWEQILINFNKYQKEFKKLKTKEKNIYLWNKSIEVGIAIGKIRNHSIGTLLINISEGMDLDIAVKKYEAIVAPINYKRPKPIYTKKMLDDAKEKLKKLGFMDSLQRRFAILEDINVNNVLFSNKDVKKRLQTKDVFAEMENDVKINPKSFSKIEKISVEDFIKNVVPTTKNIEVYFESKHSLNMVSLIAPYKLDSKTMFKWNNNFSWAYTGNITDSNIKKNVKSAGGKVDGVLRFSIQWNDGNEHNRDDYDAHCIEPKGNEIYYLNKNNYKTSGALDVDIINPKPNKAAVENITWSDMKKMKHGKYKFFVHNYAHRGGQGGFRAEIEYNGQQFKFDYPTSLRQNENVDVAEITFDGEKFTIKEKIPSSITSRKIWNVKSNTFIPISVLMHSPNYWDEQKGIGNKHYFFMLKECINDENPNGFFNEYLNNDLTKHRKVFEALGTKMKVDDVENQLSGLGFSSTQRNSIVVRIEGQIKRLLKVVF